MAGKFKQPKEPILGFLRLLLDEAAAWLPEVSSRQMFGCYTLFAGSNIFAMVGDSGRLALRLSEPLPYAEMLALPGSEPWTLGDKPMSHWLLLPESFHDEPELLRQWVARAHLLAISRPQKQRK